MISYLIVDDEPLAHDLLKEYCGMLPHLELKHQCYNALEAIQYLSQHSVDLMFLDLNMPKLKGFDFLRTLSKRPSVIVTTAYGEHALEGFELDVADYLLKPFGFDRLIKAVNKAISYQGATPLMGGGSKNTRFFIKGDKKYHQIDSNDIEFIEAYGNYSKIHFRDKMILCHESISNYPALLPADQFLRVHKSFIVSLPKIHHIEGNQLVLAAGKVPVGQTYRSVVARLYG
ncbi:MAG: response regulator transcription factor [Bacteroidota bacterium]